MIYYARSANAMGEKETLEHHLKLTSELCGKYTSEFISDDIGKWIGILHDFGKYSERFQNVLCGKEHNIDHAFIGAAFLRANLFSRAGKKSPLWPLYVCIRAHHSELDYHCDNEFIDWVNGQTISKDGKTYSLTKDEVKKAIQIFNSEVILPLKPDIPQLKIPHDRTQKILHKMLFTRMIFSSLVDADYTASAEHFDKDYIKKTSIASINPIDAWNRLTIYRNEIAKNSISNVELNNIRNIVYNCCTNAGINAEDGIYTLTAPTGSGKTLAMLAFGLQQMIERKKRRIIFVLPYLSIIEQNAAIYQAIIPQILQDHSQTEQRDEFSREISSRWDAPVILTTSVKFFESLFASKGPACRKLHNIADSVIIFDEAQSLPVNLSSASLTSLKDLSQNYGAVILFSTATQPSFDIIPEIDWKPKEIIEKNQLLFEQSKRVQTIWQLDSPIGWNELANTLVEYQNVCVIVNLRSHAQKLYDILYSQIDNVYLMTTDLCPAHRTQILSEIKERLQKNIQCILIATQCIEAGVDISFNILYRALAPLESIIQAAGRCNRNDTTKTGRFVVFIPDEKVLYPQPFYQQSSNAVLTLAARHPIQIENLEHIREYYEILFSNGMVQQKQQLIKAIEEIDFHTVAQEYKLIEDTQLHVLVPYGEKTEEIEELAQEGRAGLTVDWIRRATPFSVSTYQKQQVQDICEELYVYIGKERTKSKSGWYILSNTQFYDSKKGLNFLADFDCII